MLLPATDVREGDAVVESIQHLIEVNNTFYPGVKLSMSIGVATSTPGERLEATARRFSGFLAGGSDLDFARPLTSAMLPLAAGACYAIPHWPAVHFTAGGVRINPRAQVIDLQGAPIPRLYAAGEVTGGIHGMGRVGGNSTTAPVVFGRIAGTEAAALPPRR